MSQRGENIHKRKDGRWEGRFRTGTEKEYRSVYGKNLKEVRKKIYEKSTVDAIAVDWLAETKRTRKYSTYVKYESIYKKHIREHIGSMAVGQVDDEVCLRLLQQEHGKKGGEAGGLSPSTVSSIRSVLLQILRHGGNEIRINSRKDWRILSQNTIKPRKISVFTAAEQAALLAYLERNTDSCRLGILVCLMTGIRLGEICALETRDIQLENKRIIIRRTVQRIRTAGGESRTALCITPPKTRHSEREIPICTALEPFLREHMGHERYLVNGQKVMEPRTYQYMFARYLEEIGLERKNFHTLRHTFATNCIDSGMDAKCLSEILGHSDVNITMNRYVHPTMAMRQKQMDFLAYYCGQILENI